MRAYPKTNPRTRISVSIKTLTNTNLVLHCKSSDTVGKLKTKIEKKLKISQQSQRLVYAGKQLEDHLTLSTYGVTDMSQIYLARKMNGGGTSRIFADVSDNSLLKVRNFSEEAPVWRTAHQGLNIEGRCENPLCVAFQHKIICPRGFHEFNLMRDEDTKCPMCQSKVIPRTCGFYECAWKFDGVQAENGFSIIFQWMDARGNKCHRFDADKHRSSVKWESLLIVVKRLDESAAVSDPCAICWTGLGSSDGGFDTFACDHSFHRTCITEWFGTCTQSGNLASCPICRGELGNE